MRGLMQDWPLTCDKILEHAKINWPDRPIISRAVEGGMTATTYGEIYDRARKLSSVLVRRYGVTFGDRIATLAWNTPRHLETWYAILGFGAIYHTLNPRLFPEQIAWIANDAEDRIIFTDISFVPLLEKIQDKLPTVEAYVILTDAAHMPETSLKNAVAYEDLIAEGDGDVAWGGFDENTACGLCYTSGTTGDPKGVLYSHRGNFIHAMAACMGDAVGYKSRDVVLPVVPMFHANAWAIAFSAPMAGSSLVLPADKMDGASIYQLLDEHRVTFTAAVPTVWLMLLEHLEANDLKLPYLERVVIGGAAVPERVLRAFETTYDVRVAHTWGMTELSPIGSMGMITPELESAPLEEQLKVRMKQGRTIFTVEMRIADDDGNELPRDGETFGRLQVRGPAVASAYFKNAGGDPLDKDNWFDTGDVATLDPHGYMQIVDRTKDVIKSGGEWISTIDIENIAVGHPAVAEACVIGMAHPKWDERPALFVVLKTGQSADKAAILDFLKGKIAKWWTPDDVIFVDDLPHTATGKLDKKALRKTFADYVLPTAKVEA